MSSSARLSALRKPLSVTEGHPCGTTRLLDNLSFQRLRVVQDAKGGLG